MRSSPLKHVLIFADLVAIAACFRISYWLRYEVQGVFPGEAGPPFSYYWPAICLGLGVWILLFRAFDLDRPYGWEALIGSSRLFTATFMLVSLVLAGSYISRTYYSRLLLFFLSVLLVICLLTTRIGYHALLTWLRKYGLGLRRIVIVGQSDLARELAERIQQHPELCYELVGFLLPVAGRTQQRVPSNAVSGSEEIARELLEKKVDELIFTIPARRESEVLEFIAHCQKLGIAIRLVPEYYELHTSHISSFSIDGIPLFELKETSLRPPYQFLKSLTDYLVASLILLLFFPVLVLIGVTLHLGLGKMISREVRVGRGGVPFGMYRFNVSGAENASAGEALSWIVQFCRFLHRYSLSELPQLFNVLKGEMSIVGPRPETPERVRHYSAWHQRRLQLKPGITGLAQVRGLRGVDSSDLKTKYDLEYAANLSPLLDFTLVLSTIGALLKRGKARPATNVASAGEPLRGKLP